MSKHDSSIEYFRENRSEELSRYLGNGRRATFVRENNTWSMEPGIAVIRKEADNDIEPSGDHPFHRKGIPLACLPAEPASMVGFKRDMVFDGAAGMRGNPLVGRKSDVQIVMMNERKDPPERIGNCHYQNEPPMGFSGRKGQYAGGRGHGISFGITLQ